MGSALRPYHQFSGELSVHEGIFMKNDRLVIPISISEVTLGWGTVLVGLDTVYGGPVSPNK